MKQSLKNMPKRAKLAFGLAGVYLLGALLLLLGNGEVRAGYLQEEGQAAYAVAFFCIQLGIGLAAVALSIDATHPYKRAWKRLLRRSQVTWTLRELSVKRLVSAVGSFNALLDRREALLAQASKQVEVSLADVPRQQLMSRQWETLASPEPVQDKMFTRSVDRETPPEGSELLGSIIGVTDLPHFERRSVEEVLIKQRALGRQIDELRKKRRELYRRPDKGRILRINDEERTLDEPDEKAIARNGGGS